VDCASMRRRSVFGPGWALLLQFLMSSSPYAVSSVEPVTFGRGSESWVGSSCQLWQDEQNIPHIRAKTELAGLSCLGYLHARDRIWQMDYFKKVVDGRKAEFFGRDGIRSDFFLRLLGLKEKAESLYSEMTEDQKAPFKAYAYGVQLGSQEALKTSQSGHSLDGVYEFREYDYLPEVWHPEDSLKILLLQSFDQTRRSFENQLREEQWLEKNPKIAPQLFSSKGLPWEVSVLKEGEYPEASSEVFTHPTRTSEKQRRGLGSQALETILELPGHWHGPGAGSNNWVISGSHSKTGNALLANDPHLSLTHPPFWYWAHLSAGPLEVIGATIPGMPFFPVGVSKDLSWGVTNAFLPAARVSRVLEKDLRKSSVVRPWIWVKFWKFKLPFIFKTFRRTPRGLPVLPLPTPENQALVLNWTSYYLKAVELSGLFDLPKMKTVSQADQLLGTFGVPSWNLVFADSQGDIGYRAVGRIPRFEHDPPFGVPLESFKNVEESKAFTDPLSPEEMPHVLRPQRGWIVTANNRQWPEDSLWSAGTAQHLSLRAFRIEELLDQTAHHDLDSLRKVQCDLQAVDARFLLPRLLEVMKESLTGENHSVEEKAVELLTQWDYQAGIQCQACPIYRRWIDRIQNQATLNPVALYRKLENKFRDSEFEKLIRREFSLALADLHLVGGGSHWPNWGYFHQNSFFHLLGKDLFRASSIPTPGDEYSVNPGTAEWNGSRYDQTAGASQRILIEMSRPPQIYAIVAGPQKDLNQRNLASGEWQRWVNCEASRRLFPLDWSQVESKITKIQL